MSKLNYDEKQKIEMNATKKLISFVKKEVEIEEILEEINFVYPFFQDENNRVAFNIWLSIDYVNKDGKSFIDRFLENHSSSLKPLEKKILIDKNKSYVSLFEIIGYEEEYMIIRDALQNQEHKLWEPHLNNLLNEGEFVFARIGKILDNYSFIGEISYLPFSVKSMFVDTFLVNFNRIRKDSPDLSVMEYLKKYSLELYEVYNNCIIDALENNEDITSYFYDEIDEFEGYLHRNTNSLILAKHITNLMEFFEYYLVDEDLTLYDLDQIDFKNFFKIAIKDGFINSQEDLNSYLSTFKKYISFLNNKTSEYKEVYLELLEISENRFYYMQKLKALSSPFSLDKGLVDNIALALNETAISLIINFDKFILYTVDKPLELTAKNKYIKRKHLLELEDLFEEDVPVKIKSPNQEDLPIIHLFYKISLKLGLMIINGDHLIITKKGINFIRLKDEEKFAIIFKYIWSKDFINEVTDLNSKLIEKIKKNFIDMVLSFSPDDSYGIATIISTFEDFPSFFIQFNKYLKYLGLIKTNFYPDYNFEITSLGKTIFKYINEKEKNLVQNSVVHLDNYRNKEL